MTLDQTSQQSLPAVDISIVVGTLNRLDYLKRCVDSVLKETNRSFRLYVTDAGSTDGTEEYLRSIASDQVKPILIGRRLGQARAYNDVFKTLTSRYVCWISDDNEIVNGGLDLAAGILDGDSRIGMVALKVRDRQGPFVDAPYIGGVSPLGILNVNQGMLPLAVLRQVGYFSETFRDYGIDPDLTAKVLLSGHDVVYTRPVAIHHYRLWEMDKSKPEYRALKQKHERATQLYRAKYEPAFRPQPMWLAKKAVWKLIRTGLGSRFNPNGKTAVLGRLPRDWSNILTCRYISLFDAVFLRERNFHLRQRGPKFFRPRQLPSDPVFESHPTSVEGKSAS